MWRILFTGLCIYLNYIMYLESYLSYILLIIFDHNYYICTCEVNKNQLKVHFLSIFILFSQWVIDIYINFIQWQLMFFSLHTESTKNILFTYTPDRRSLVLFRQQWRLGILPFHFLRTTHFWQFISVNQVVSQKMTLQNKY